MTPSNPLIPNGSENVSFVSPQLPTDPFMIKYPDDSIDGPFDPDEFITDPETNIAYSHNSDGHPIFLRVVEQFGTGMDVMDGDGTIYHYELQTLPNNETEVEDATPPPPVNAPTEEINNG